MLQKMTIKSKLIIGFILIGLIPMIILGFVSLGKFKTEIKNVQMAKLEAANENKKVAVELLIKQWIIDIESQRNRSICTKAQSQYKKYLESGVRTKEFNRYHSIVESFINSTDYYDYFVIDKNGQIIETAALESDYNTNLLTGKYSNTNLARAFKQSIKGDIFFVDFEPYAPSNGEPAAFITAPIMNNNQIDGVVALQISLETIQLIMNERKGLGKTGESYMVGKDKLMRSDSYLDEINHTVKSSFKNPQKGSVNTEAVKKALNSEIGNGIIKDYNGNDVLSSWDYIDLPCGVRWVIITEIDVKEVFNPVHILTISMVWILLIFGIIAALFGIYLALNISGGIKKVIDGFSDLTEDIINGKLDSRGDVENTMIDFKGIIEKNNDLIEAFVHPINVTAEYIDRISKGDIPEKINDEYKGDFNEIKNNLNTVIDVINKTKIQLENLVENVEEGFLTKEIEIGFLKGVWKDILQSVNFMTKLFVGHFNSIPTPIMIVDKEFNIKFMNETGLNLVGMSLTQLLNTKCYNALKTSDCQSEKCAIYQAMTKSTKADRETDSHPQGKNMEIYYSGSPIRNRNNEVVGGIEITIDQTEQKRLQKKNKKIRQYRAKQVEALVGVLEKLSEGDMTVKLSIDEADEDTLEAYDAFERIQRSLNSTIKSINKLLVQVDIASDQITSASGQISSGSQNLAEGSSEQASSLEEVASSLEEMNSLTQSNAGNAQEGKRLANESMKAINTGRDNMENMRNSINEIKTSSEETSKIIKTIDEIAFQTNLLALNAAVEAAHAGEAGKGFAVVAEEVKNLALRSAEAAKNTNDLIERALNNSEKGVKIVSEVVMSFNDIKESFKKVSDIVGEIATSSQEQSQGIKEINQGVNELNKITQQNAANAEESASAAEELNSQSIEMKRMVGEFQLDRSEIDFHEKRIKKNLAINRRKVKKISGPKNSYEIDPEKILPLEDVSDDDFRDF